MYVKCVNEFNSLGPKIIIIHACALLELFMRLTNVQLNFGVVTSTRVCEAFWLVLHPCVTYLTSAPLVESYQDSFVLWRPWFRWWIRRK